jgi:glucose/arabinose dehydrogenase
MKVFSLFFIIVLFITACGTETATDPIDSNDPPDNGDDSEEALVPAFPNLNFDRPLRILHPGDETNRLFVVEQRGIISVFENDPDTGQSSVFLNIEGRVNDSSNEQGLLGLAFHPDFESNGFFYVNYTASAPDRTIISRFSVSAGDPNEADPESELILLSYNQPFSNHNGGHLEFGPDGYLYISSGDGGSGGDPDNNGQTRSTLLGSILRIDVDNPENGNDYGIPAGNPFINNNQDYREEIYAWGLRNPWRFSFDVETDELWAADVGQNSRESIYIVENGKNYGWNILEGSACYPSGDSCDKTGLELPIYEYSHGSGDRSVTGGYVYRGNTWPELQGLYIYGDFVSGRIWALDASDPENPVNTELIDTNLNISSFGTDQHNELYICAFDGNIYRPGSAILEALE